MKKLFALIVLLFLIGCGGETAEPTNATYRDSIICYANDRDIVFSAEGVKIVQYNVYWIYYEDGGRKSAPIDSCFVTYED